MSETWYVKRYSRRILGSTVPGYRDKLSTRGEEEARNPVKVEYSYSPKRLGEKNKGILDRDRRTEMRMRLSNLNSVEMERCSTKRVRPQSGPIRDEPSGGIGTTALRSGSFA